MIAIQENEDDLLTELLEKGADPNEEDTRGRTGLEIAIRQGNIDCVTKLTMCGARLPPSSVFRSVARSHSSENPSLACALIPGFFLSMEDAIADRRTVSSADARRDSSDSEDDDSGQARLMDLFDIQMHMKVWAGMDPEHVATFRAEYISAWREFVGRIDEPAKLAVLVKCFLQYGSYDECRTILLGRMKSIGI
jgi:hypothetical protein